jgi:phage terminase large subunit-like protein
MKSGTGAREQPIILSISSGGYVSDGPYDELFKRGTRFLMGESQERRLLPLFYMIDDIQKWDDINELYKSLPGLGESVSVEFIQDEIATAHESLSKKVEFLTKYCNVKQNSSQAWLSAQDINLCIGEELKLEDFRKSYCVGGIDLSRTTDLTAACVLVEKMGELYVFAHFFMPENKQRFF